MANMTKGQNNMNNNDILFEAKMTVEDFLDLVNYVANSNEGEPVVTEVSQEIAEKLQNAIYDAVHETLNDFIDSNYDFES